MTRTVGDKPEITRLPSPRPNETLSLAQALAARRSLRAFTPDELTLQQISDLCWSAQGITEASFGLRTAPSAGALYPVTLLIADGHGVWEYRPRGHCLSRVLSREVRAELREAALLQPCVREAAACFIIAVDQARSASRYGERAHRYCLIESGHIAQNILLQATALDLAGVPVGAFDDAKVAEVLELPSHLTPVLLIPVGTPR